MRRAARTASMSRSFKMARISIPVILLALMCFIIIPLFLKPDETTPESSIIYPGLKGKGPESTTEEPTTQQTYSSPTPTTSAKSHQTACGVPVKSGPMVKVGDSKSYVIGSYVEHRLERKMIRTVAIVLRSEQVEYYCVLCCDGREVSVAASCDIHSDHFGFEYGAADITCPVPKTCTTPAHVAITYRRREGHESLWKIQSFQPVRNQQPRTENFPYTFTVCISAMIDYSNVLGLVQAMEMFKILGVQKVAIYRTSCDPAIQKILDYYVRQGFVDIIPWTVTSYINVSSGWMKSLSPGELHYYGIIPALTDCVYRYMYESQYVALQDLDELILPITGENWATLIHQLEVKYPHHAGFMFENNVFPIYVSSHQKPEYTPELWNYITGENILPHVYRIPQNIPEKYSNFKVIVNPRLVFRPTVHGLLQSTGGAVWVDPNIARMYHIKAVSGQKRSKRSLIRDTRLWDYAGKLIPAVSEVLKQALNIH